MDQEDILTRLVDRVWKHEAKLSAFPLRMPCGIQLFLVAEDRQEQPLYLGCVFAVFSVAGLITDGTARVSTSPAQA